MDRMNIALNISKQVRRHSNSLGKLCLHLTHSLVQKWNTSTLHPDLPMPEHVTVKEISMFCLVNTHTHTESMIS